MIVILACCTCRKKLQFYQLSYSGIHVFFFYIVFITTYPVPLVHVSVAGQKVEIALHTFEEVSQFICYTYRTARSWYILILSVSVKK